MRHLRELSNLLKIKGLILGEPADDALLNQMRQLIPGVDGQIVEFYQLFNGIRENESRTGINLWSIDQVLKELTGTKSRFNEREYIAFGDLFVESDLIMINPNSSNDNIILLYEERIIADSLSDFLNKLYEGDFNLNFGV